MPFISGYQAYLVQLKYSSNKEISLKSMREALRNSLKVTPKVILNLDLTKKVELSTVNSASSGNSICNDAMQLVLHAPISHNECLAGKLVEPNKRDTTTL
ncbi:hypothetical protein REPUB_Repub03eG0192000 [Reevesia pubescens]